MAVGCLLVPRAPVPTWFAQTLGILCFGGRIGDALCFFSVVLRWENALVRPKVDLCRWLCLKFSKAGSVRPTAGFMLCRQQVSLDSDGSPVWSGPYPCAGGGLDLGKGGGMPTPDLLPSEYSGDPIVVQDWTELYQVRQHSEC